MLDAKKVKVGQLKRELESIQYLDVMIQEVQEEIGYIDLMMGSLRSPTMDSPHIENHSSKDPLLSDITRKSRLEKKLRSYKRKRERLIDIIDSIDNEIDHAIIYDLFVRRLNYQQVANRNYFSLNYLYRKVNSILERCI